MVAKSWRRIKLTSETPLPGLDPRATSSSHVSSCYGRTIIEAPLFGKTIKHCSKSANIQFCQHRNAMMIVSSLQVLLWSWERAKYWNLWSRIRLAMEHTPRYRRNSQPTCFSSHFKGSFYFRVKSFFRINLPQL